MTEWFEDTENKINNADPIGLNPIDIHEKLADHKVMYL